MTGADADALAEVHELLSDEKQWVWVPAWCRKSVPSEAAAIVLARLLYWCGPKDISKQGRSVRARTGWYDEVGLQRVPAGDRELAKQTGLPPATVNRAIRSLTRLFNFRIDKTSGARQAVPRPSHIAWTYQACTSDDVVDREFPKKGVGKRWCDSETAINAMRSGTSLHPKLMALAGRKPLDARALSQILYRFRPGSRHVPEDGWWKTTLQRFADELGVCDDTVAACLARLSKSGLIKHVTHRTGLGVASVRTWLSPCACEILHRLEGLP